MPVGLREVGDVVVFDLTGELRLGTEAPPSIHRMISDQLASGKTKVLLNFAAVDFIDSYGVGDIVAAHASVQKKNARMKLAALSPKIWLIFNYSGLTRILEIYDSEEKALRSFT